MSFTQDLDYTHYLWLHQLLWLGKSSQISGTASETGCTSGPAVGHNLCMLWGCQALPSCYFGKNKTLLKHFSVARNLQEQMLQSEQFYSHCKKKINLLVINISLGIRVLRGAHILPWLWAEPSRWASCRFLPERVCLPYSTCNPV